ncbi:MAG: ArsR/SmtB family transcription factor [Solirubrobacteraceae bacterium]
MAGDENVIGRDRDLAPIGALVGHPVRAAMLAVLADGRALPAGELARHARIAPATATAHLRRLVNGGLVRVHVQGRHRYHELAGPEVAAALEALARIAPPVTIRSLRQDRTQQAIVEARTCYDHLAGRVGVELRDRLLADDALRPDGPRDHVLTDHGHQRLAALDLDPHELLRSRRTLARTCIDWTHRRPHLAGAIPAAITTRLIELGWLSRTTGRGLRLAPDYPQRLNAWLSRDR